MFANYGSNVAPDLKTIRVLKIIDGLSKTFFGEDLPSFNLHSITATLTVKKIGLLVQTASFYRKDTRALTEGIGNLKFRVRMKLTFVQHSSSPRRFMLE